MPGKYTGLWFVFEAAWLLFFSCFAQEIGSIGYSGLQNMMQVISSRDLVQNKGAQLIHNSVGKLILKEGKCEPTDLGI